MKLLDISVKVLDKTVTCLESSIGFFHHLDVVSQRADKCFTCVETAFLQSSYVAEMFTADGLGESVVG